MTLSAPVTSTRTWHDYAARVPFRLGVVTNEISEDFIRACEVAAALGIGDVELNSIWDRPVTELSDDEARRVGEIVRSHGLRVNQVIGPAFKALPLDEVAAPGAAETPAHAKHRRVLERSVELAHLLGTGRVRVFAFRRPRAGIEAGTPGWRPSPDVTEVELDALRRGFQPLVRLAEREGVTLMVENVRYSYADTGAHSRQVLDAIDSARVRLIWDPANAYVSGEAQVYPDGYRAVAQYTAHVHVKDARFTDRATGATAWRRVGDGDVPLLDQVRALRADGYAGVISLETHWRLPGDAADTAERSTIETWYGLAGLLDQALGGAR
ncbi:MAG: sugar phosphate isomerase/epimerase [Chloroflexi bacterium]|nr:sugar phosphate isomerase/epimerase [Chloroflexota bacterium]